MYGKGNKYLRKDDSEHRIDHEDSEDSEDEIDIHEIVRNGTLAEVKESIARDRPRLIALKDELGRTVLHYAAELDRVKIALHLIAKNADINARDHQEKTPLHLAAAKGHTEMCRFLLDFNANIRLKDKQCWSALHHAVYGNHYETATLLIKHGIPCNTEDLQYGRTPLHLAAEYGYTEMCNMLILRGADLYAVGDIYYSKTPLHIACLNNHIETMKVLIQRGSDLNALSGLMDKAPLHLVSELGYIQAAELLLQNGANVNLMGTKINGNSPLHLACYHNHLPMVELLLYYKADINQQGKYTTLGSPLHIACLQGYLPIIQTLISHGAEVNILEYSTRRTPLHIACLQGHYEIALFLIEHGRAKYNEIYDLQHYLPLDYMKDHLMKEKLKLICKKMDEIYRLEEVDRLQRIQAEQEHQTRLLAQRLAEETAYQLALEMKRKQRKAYQEELKMIVTKSGESQALIHFIQTHYNDNYDYCNVNHCNVSNVSNVNDGSGSSSGGNANSDIGDIGDLNMILDDETGYTALILACQSCYYDLVKVLLSIPYLNLNHQDKVLHNTALHYAAKLNHRDIIEELLLHGANTMIANRYGEVPANCASNDNLREILRNPKLIHNRSIYRDQVIQQLYNSNKNKRLPATTTTTTTTSASTGFLPPLNPAVRGSGGGGGGGVGGGVGGESSSSIVSSISGLDDILHPLNSPRVESASQQRVVSLPPIPSATTATTTATLPRPMTTTTTTTRPATGIVSIMKKKSTSSAPISSSSWKKTTSSRGNSMMSHYHQQQLVVVPGGSSQLPYDFTSCRLDFFLMKDMIIKKVELYTKEEVNKELLLLQDNQLKAINYKYPITTTNTTTTTIASDLPPTGGNNSDGATGKSGNIGKSGNSMMRDEVKLMIANLSSRYKNIYILQYSYPPDAFDTTIEYTEKKDLLYLLGYPYHNNQPSSAPNTTSLSLDYHNNDIIIIQEQYFCFGLGEIMNLMQIVFIEEILPHHIFDSCCNHDNPGNTNSSTSTIIKRYYNQLYNDLIHFTKTKRREMLLPSSLLNNEEDQKRIIALASLSLVYVEYYLRFYDNIYLSSLHTTHSVALVNTMGSAGLVNIIHNGELIENHTTTATQQSQSQLQSSEVSWSIEKLIILYYEQIEYLTNQGQMENETSILLKKLLNLCHLRNIFNTNNNNKMKNNNNMTMTSVIVERVDDDGRSTDGNQEKKDGIEATGLLEKEDDMVAAVAEEEEGDPLKKIWSEVVLNPPRAFRQAIDHIFELSVKLLRYLEQRFPQDFIRATLWYYQYLQELELIAQEENREKLQRIEEVVNSSNGQLPRTTTTETPLLPPAVTTTMGNNRTMSSLEMKITALTLWLFDLQLIEFEELFREEGFKNLEDFLGLSEDDIFRFFPFLPIGDRRRLVRQCEKLSSGLITLYERRAMGNNLVDHDVHSITTV